VIKYFFLATVLVTLISCTKEKKKANDLTLSIPQEVSSLDPANCFDLVCYVPVAQVYETLFELEYLKRPYSLRPLLAESMPTISRDRLKYTIKIKKGVKYHKSDLLPEGRTLKAQDFVNQIKRLAFKGSKSQGWWLFDSKVKGLNEWREKVGTDLELFFKTDVAGVRATDDETLVIELIQPYPQLLWGLSISLTAPVPEEAIKASKNDLAMKTVGTGPYFISSYHPTQEIILEKNTEYNNSVYPSEGDRYAHEKSLLKDAGKKLPFIDKLKLVVIKEAQTDWLNFRAKKIDMLNLSNNQNVALNEAGKLNEELVKDNVQMQLSPTLIYWWIAFNMNDPLFGKNLNLRKAIAHAVNMDEYIEKFTLNIHQKANSIYPPGIPGYSPSAELPYKYDLKLAKEYLAKAGYPDGKGLPQLFYDVRGTDTRKREMGEFISQELKAINVDVIVRTQNFPTFLDKARKGELQFFQGGWVMDYPDAENSLQTLYSKNAPNPNYSQYNNPDFDKLYLQLRGMEDGPQKYELMAKMEEMVNADLPWIMQYYSRNSTLYHPYVDNFRFSDIIYNYVKYLKIKPQ
jgi:oligopeptide transport system substrate-binding protein